MQWLCPEQDHPSVPDRGTEDCGPGPQGSKFQEIDFYNLTQLLSYLRKLDVFLFVF